MEREVFIRRFLFQPEGASNYYQIEQTVERMTFDNGKVVEAILVSEPVPEGMLQ